MLNAQEFVILVDDQDHALGLEEKLKVHQEGLLHRAFSIFVFRQRTSGIELLMQQRHSNKYHCAGLWTNTCCSHPRWGESIIQAGQRRLKEEMSINIPLREIGSFQYCAKLDNGLIEHEFDHVLIGEYDEDYIQYNPLEVEDACWQALPTLIKALAAHPEQYTPWFKSVLDLVGEHICLKS